MDVGAQHMIVDTQSQSESAFHGSISPTLASDRPAPALLDIGTQRSVQPRIGTRWLPHNKLHPTRQQWTERTVVLRGVAFAAVGEIPKTSLNDIGVGTIECWRLK